MKKLLYAALLLLFAATATATAQTAEPLPAEITVEAGADSVRPRYGTVRFEALLEAMPEYAHAQTQLAALRQQQEAETLHNEEGFRRMFADFLQGQKDFPQNILLKRQRELQEALEKGIAFRQAAEDMLRNARRDLEAPVRDLLRRAISAAAQERGYEMLLDIDANGMPYTDPALTEDATPYVEQQLGILRQY